MTESIFLSVAGQESLQHLIVTHPPEGPWNLTGAKESVTEQRTSSLYCMCITGAEGFFFHEEELCVFLCRV